MWQDMRLAVRALRKEWAVSGTVVLSLALGLSIAMSVLALVDAAFFRPLPVRDPATLSGVYTVSAKDTTAPYRSTSLADFADMRALFESAAAFGRLPVHTSGGALPTARRLQVEVFTPGYFATVGVQAAEGRHPDAPGEIAVSMRLRRMGVAPGQTLRLGDAAATVVGVLPEAFRGTILDWGGAPDVWVPIADLASIAPVFRRIDYRNNRNIRWLLVVARLRQGVAQTQAALDVMGARLAADHPASNAGFAFRALSSHEARFWPGQREQSERFAYLLAAMALGILLVAIFNAGGAMLARTLSRRQEIRMRLALGARRFRASRPVLLECATLTVLGGLLSIPFTVWMLTSLRAFPLPFLIPIALDLQYDARILAFAGGVVLLAMPCIAFAPGWLAMRTGHLGSAVRAGDTGGSGLRLTVVTAQIAFTFALLAGAGMLYRSLESLRATPLGYETGGVVIAKVYVEDHPRMTELLDRVRTLPGAAARAALSSEVLPGMTRVVRKVDGIEFHSSVISDGYFETIRMPLVAGRDFQRGEKVPAAIVNQRAAHLLWGDAAIGRTLQIEGEASPREVVGIARDARYHEVFEDPLPYLFLPMTAGAPPLREMTLHVAGGVTPALLRTEFRLEAETLDAHVQCRLSQPRLASMLGGVGAGASLLLSSLGLYAIVAYDVRRRRREIGIRIALGAGQSHVMGVASRSALMTLACGLAAGGVLAALGIRLIRAQLHNVPASDPLHYVGVTVVMCVVAALAAARPIASALRVHPAELLRTQ